MADDDGERIIVTAPAVKRMNHSGKDIACGLRLE
jgi:hypothetical protein